MPMEPQESFLHEFLDFGRIYTEAGKVTAEGFAQVAEQGDRLEPGCLACIINVVTPVSGSDVDFDTQHGSQFAHDGSRVVHALT